MSTHQKFLMDSQSTVSTNWTLNVSDIRAVKISNISPAASKPDIREFFSFSGDIQYLEVQKETEGTQVAYITFKDSQGAQTAVLLTGAVIVDRAVTITLAEDYQLPPEALVSDMNKSPTAASVAVKNAEDMVSTMLAKGYSLGIDAINKAKAFDEQHHLTSNASATVASIDRKVGFSEKLNIGTAVVNGKVKEMDERFQVSEITKSALAAAEQKAMDAGSAIMSNHYVSTGASWFSNALTVVARTAEDVGLMTKEKVEKAEEEKRESFYRDRAEIISHFAEIHLDDYSGSDPPVVSHFAEIHLDDDSASDPSVVPVESTNR